RVVRGWTRADEGTEETPLSSTRSKGLDANGRSRVGLSPSDRTVVRVRIRPGHKKDLLNGTFHLGRRVTPCSDVHKRCTGSSQRRPGGSSHPGGRPSLPGPGPVRARTPLHSSAAVTAHR